MISYADALAIVHQQIAVLAGEWVDSADAEGRVLAQALSSPAELPVFDNSAMDGFALPTAGRGATAGSEHVIGGSVAAGEDAGGIAAGHAWEIMTGAGLPAGADAVVPIEQVDVLAHDGPRPSRIRLRTDLRAGQHIRRRGEDVALHDRVIAAGTVLRAAHLMLLAALGCARVQVVRRPRVALIATGRELVGDPAQLLQPGQIRDGTSSYLLSQLRAAGAEVVWHGQVGDDAAGFDPALAQARNAGADVILSTGAVSRGRYDFVPDALARHGAAVLFHKVAVRPGKPVLLARFEDGVLYVGLPGNPMASAAGLRFCRAGVARLAWHAGRARLAGCAGDADAGTATLAAAPARTLELQRRRRALRADPATAGVVPRGAVAAGQCVGSAGTAGRWRRARDDGAGVRAGPSAAGRTGACAMSVRRHVARCGAGGRAA